MNLQELEVWRGKFEKANDIPKMKPIAIEFNTQLNNQSMKGWEVYELLRGDNFGLVVALLEKANETT